MPGDNRIECERSLEELSLLAKTAGVKVISVVSQFPKTINPATCMGKGKVDEIKELCVTNEANLIIIDRDISGIQVRNLEKITDCKVIDRTELILDIFAQRARTAEAKLQVELAQLNYLLPRLTGRGITLSRLGGGIGTRGPGETKLESDRRRIRRKIIHLNASIEAVKDHRKEQRSSRKKRFYVAVLVGYTNAGKSTLFNALTEEDVIVRDALFTTLDPTTRIITLSNKCKLLISDTVGFIQNLPHQLVDAFAATLEEIIEADIIIHVVSADSPSVEMEIKSVLKTLTELKIDLLTKPVITVLNKIDLIKEPDVIRRLQGEIPQSVAISALYKNEVDQLVDMIMTLLGSKSFSVTISQSDGKLYAWLHEYGHIIHEEYLGNNIKIEVEMPSYLTEKVLMIGK